MTKVLLAHPGTQHAIFLARQFYKKNLLFQFHTCFVLHENGFWTRVIKRVNGDFYYKLKNRIVSGISNESLLIYPFIEAYFLILSKVNNGSKKLISKRNSIFQESIKDKYLLKSDVIVGFDTSSLILIQNAEKSGKPFILEQSIGHPISSNKVCKKLAQENEAWRNSWEPKSENEIFNEVREHELSDLIIVPSNFVKNTLTENGVLENKIRVNPYGIDIDFFRPNATISKSEKLVFLFVGSISTRKGVHILLQAWSKLKYNNAELWIVGSGDIPNEILVTLPNNIKVLGKANKSELLCYYQRASVFVFPSYFEGLAIVQLEAAACGLPIIGTFSSGASEIVDVGVNGFIIDSGDSDALAQKMQYFIDNPQVIPEMSRKARAKAEQFTWDAYGDRWEKIINEVVSC